MLGRVHDVVIVGAGSAGCVLAARLTRGPRDERAPARGRPARPQAPRPGPRGVLEALPLARSTGATTRSPQAALDGRRVVFPRGKVLGGSASINAMMAIRGHRADHDAWPAGWGWDDVAGAYARSDRSSRGPPTQPEPAHVATSSTPPPSRGFRAPPTSTARTTRARARRRCRSAEVGASASWTATCGPALRRPESDGRHRGARHAACSSRAAAPAALRTSIDGHEEEAHAEPRGRPCRRRDRHAELLLLLSGIGPAGGARSGTASRRRPRPPRASVGISAITWRTASSPRSTRETLYTAERAAAPARLARAPAGGR